MVHQLFVAGSGLDHAAGWGFCLVLADEVVAERGQADRAENVYRTELTGLVQGLRAVPSGAVEVVISNKNIILTGSEWLPKWRSRGWKRSRGAIQHLDLVQALASELDRLDVRWSLADPKADYFVRAKGFARNAARALSNDPYVIVGPPGAAAVEPAPSTARVVAYTNGGSRGNSGVGGWGFLLIDVPTGVALERRGGEADTTNNRMEVTAAIEALSTVTTPGQQVEIRTDSEYLRQMAESWLERWKRRGWCRVDGEQVLNMDLVRQLDELLGQHAVTWTRVAAHAGEPGNEHVDALMKAAMDSVEAGGDGCGEKRHKVSPVAVRSEDHT